MWGSVQILLGLAGGFMKKLFVLIGILAVSTHGSTAYASSRVESGSGSTRPKPHGGCWRILFSCCCQASTVDLAVGTVVIVHRALEAILASSTPEVVREIYLLCQNIAYVLSDTAVTTLNEKGFLTELGNLKDGWREHIRSLLVHDESAASPEAFYLEQRTEDLIAQHPEHRLTLIEAAINRNPHISADLIALLYQQYQLIKSPTAISLDDIDAIVAAIHKEEERAFATAKHVHGAATSRASGTISSPMRFRLLPIE